MRCFHCNGKVRGANKRKVKGAWEHKYCPPKLEERKDEKGNTHTREEIAKGVFTKTFQAKDNSKLGKGKMQMAPELGMRKDKPADERAMGIRRRQGDTAENSRADGHRRRTKRKGPKPVPVRSGVQQRRAMVRTTKSKASKEEPEKAVR